MARHIRKRKRIIYHPPSPQAIQKYAQEVCKRLGATYDTPEVISGFANYIKLATTIWSEHLNASGESEEKLDSKHN